MVQRNTVARNSSYELLRIVAMMMIVFHHYVEHGLIGGGGVSIPTLWCNFISIGGKIGYNIFVLISGYFLVADDSPTPNLRKLLKLWLQVIFYSLSLFLIAVVFGLTPLTFKTVIKAMMPITFSTWGFASVYFVLYLLHPFINVFIKALDRKTYKTVLLLLIGIWSIIPTFTTSAFKGSSLTWFVTLYLIAGYIRIYGLNPKWKAKQYTLFSIGVILVSYLTSVVFSLLGTKSGFFAAHALYFYGQEKITMLLAAVGIFLVFHSVQIPYNKIINLIGSATFGVYLIHDSPSIKKWLWLECVKTTEYSGSISIIIHSIVACITIYIICTIIDLIRKKTIEPLCLQAVNKCKIQLPNGLKNIINKIDHIIFG